MVTFTKKNWFRIAVINLIFVALLGTLMRYKIAFDFPFFNQKNLLHAHSHFAFAGWISHFIYTGLAYLVIPYISSNKKKFYDLIILVNLICSYGMLIAFTAQGYGAVSIALSTCTILIALVFGIQMILDLKHLPKRHRSKPWIVSGLFLNIISAAGPLTLAYMLANHAIDHKLYLGSLYYYLHFQYSGWFFFGVMAIIIAKLPLNFPSLRTNFWLFAVTIVPTFFLSILWVHIPKWVYFVTVVATFIQLYAWIDVMLKTSKYLKTYKQHLKAKWIGIFFYASAIALTLKFILQAISVIPSLSQLVFGIRPVVIAYLHLVLLGVFSLFILAYLFNNGTLKISPLSRNALFGFLSGIILNEMLLGTQGLSAFFYISIPFINEMLLGAAIIILLSVTTLVFSQFGTSEK